MAGYLITTEPKKPQFTAIRVATLARADLAPWLTDTYARVGAFLAAHRYRTAGPPFARYHRLATGRFDVEAGFPVTTPIRAVTDIRAGTLPGGPVASTMHFGPFDESVSGHKALTAWITDHRGRPVGDSWEIYFRDPTRATDPATWRTEIVQPLTTSGILSERSEFATR
jgi:effector-binding domain-containing protein